MSRFGYPPLPPGFSVRTAQQLTPTGPPIPEGRGVTARFGNAAARAAYVPAIVGQIGVQLDTGELYRSTAIAAGSWTLIVSPGSIVESLVVRNTADQAIAAGAAATNAANLTDLAFSIGASEVWQFESLIKVSSDANGGTAYALDIPAGATTSSFVDGDGAFRTALNGDFITADSTLTGAVFITTPFTGVVRVSGVVENGTNAGTVQLQIAAGNNTSNLSIKANSYLVARKL